MADLEMLARESISAWNRHDLDRYLDFYADDAVYIAPRRRVEGREELRRHFDMLMEAFPHEHATVHDIAVSGNIVYLRYSDTAKHEGTMRWSSRRRIEPTGRSFSYEGVTEIRFEGGKIVHAQDFFDLYELLFVHLAFPFPGTNTAPDAQTTGSTR